ncbi:MAG: helix-turn-helix domain-containing protein [Bacteroidota bacterium]
MMEKIDKAHELLASDIRIILLEMMQMVQEKSVKIYSVKEFEELTGYHPNTQRELRDNGEISYIKRNRKIWYKPEHILDFLNHYEVPACRPNN